MRSFSIIALVTTLAAFSVATPLNIDNRAIADALPASISNRDGSSDNTVDARQLAPPGTPVIGNVDWAGLSKEIQRQLDGLADITADDAKVAVRAIMDILQGKNVAEAAQKLFFLPGNFFIRLPFLIAPVLIRAGMGIPGVNNFIMILLKLMPNLGNGLGGNKTFNDDSGSSVGNADQSQVKELVTRVMLAEASGAPVSAEDAAAFKGLDMSVLGPLFLGLPAMFANMFAGFLFPGNNGPIKGPIL
ncbi:hypothetical protein CspeluHIS016_0700670 [Cutaneotrichosporon spelunceum]|uniref:Uncharacterized protein n=1 Tax=Cutaneotrichosporon spelunceum TaxID=1672016 RepID=A0AAD3TZ46_9TREE|nr:hypothetical protein CspeluHIS016_0700670 [Cutaneotrichosporon spelunceum]